MENRTILASDMPKGRDLVLAAVRADPGVSLTEVQERTGLSIATIYYHVRRMEGEGMLETHAVGRRRVVFVHVAAADLGDACSVVLLKGTSCHQVAMAVATWGTATIPQLVAHTGMSPRAVYHHVKSLKDAGLLSSSSTTRYVEITASPRLRLALARAQGAGSCASAGSG